MVYIWFIDSYGNFNHNKAIDKLKGKSALKGHPTRKDSFVGHRREIHMVVHNVKIFLQVKCIFCQEETDSNLKTIQSDNVINKLTDYAKYNTYSVSNIKTYTLSL